MDLGNHYVSFALSQSDELRFAREAERRRIALEAESLRLAAGRAEMQAEREARRARAARRAERRAAGGFARAAEVLRGVVRRGAPSRP